jgi:glycosyl-4,4'-diaponeurosporenoate acyltransferase
MLRLIELSSVFTLVLDFAAWFVFHMAAALITLNMPDRWFDSDHWLYQTRNWERQGQIWHQLFRVRYWKERLPDGAQMIGRGYAKKRLRATHDEELARFVQESRRAELTHYLAMLPAPLFFLWNPAWAGWFMIGYALVANAPCIIAQRYNRPRFKKLLEKRALGTKIHSSSNDTP